MCLGFAPYSAASCVVVAAVGFTRGQETNDEYGSALFTPWVLVLPGKTHKVELSPD